MKDPAFARYWRSNLLCLGVLLAIWFAVSFGAGILWVDALNGIALGGFKLGFWFAQQGSIYTFVVLIFVYTLVMQRLERRYRDGARARPNQRRSPGGLGACPTPG